jgi:isocitrate/isopropylmalate dehydrogenase
MNLVIVRGNTECLWSNRNIIGGMGKPMLAADMVFAVSEMTVKDSARTRRAGFKLAHGRRKEVTAIHEANRTKLSDGLFHPEVHKVVRRHPDVGLEDLIVDAAALLVRTPDRFGLNVTTAIFGDILSDEPSELSASQGLSGLINYGARICVAQAQRDAAPDIAGGNLPNPSSLIRSGAMLLPGGDAANARPRWARPR